MATITPTVIKNFDTGTIRGKIVHWDLITEADTPAAYEVSGFADKSIDINGTFGGGTIAIHGANHPTSAVYSVLTDPNDGDITLIGADKIKVALQHTSWIKPIRTGGAGMDVDITMLLYNST
jgi:hypothetical protein